MLANLDKNYKRDFLGETFRDSYMNHSATAIRARVVKALATQNGHGTYE